MSVMPPSSPPPAAKTFGNQTELEALVTAAAAAARAHRADQSPRQTLQVRPQILQAVLKTVQKQLKLLDSQIASSSNPIMTWIPDKRCAPCRYRDVASATLLCEMSELGKRIVARRLRCWAWLPSTATRASTGQACHPRRPRLGPQRALHVGRLRHPFQSYRQGLRSASAKAEAAQIIIVAAMRKLVCIINANGAGRAALDELDIVKKLNSAESVA